MEINIEIYKDESSKLCFAIFQGKRLFDFTYRKMGSEWVWVFWPICDFDTRIFKGKNFPMEYFKNLCIAKYYEEYAGQKGWGIDMPTKVKIVSGNALVNGKF